MTEPLFITTAIPYVNARPHLGFALELVLADAIARAHREAGFDVRFQSGTDDNSLKNVRAAAACHVPVAEFVARGARAFRSLIGALDISIDDFISTGSDPRHARGAQALWRAVSADISTRDYEGTYCVGCEAFVESCVEHDEPLEAVSERNYFFLLSRHAAWLHEVIGSGELEIIPASRRNEVLRVIEGGLRDLSISRSVERARGWGVPTPDDPTQVQYVWFDALGNYITALGYPERTGAFARWWGGSGRRVHVLGKNITRFHAIYWPAILRAAGLPIPSTLVVHGFVTQAGRKLSKSRGGGPDPIALVQRFGSDVVRYALLRHDASDDFDLTEEEIARVARAELSDQLGNLVSRVLSLIASRCGGAIPVPSEHDPSDRALRDRAAHAAADATRALLAYRPDRAVEAIRSLIADANRAIVEVKPWERAGGDARLGSHLSALARVLDVIATSYRPIIPAAAREIERRLREPITPGPPLFPKS